MLPVSISCLNMQILGQILLYRKSICFVHGTFADTSCKQSKESEFDSLQKSKSNIIALLG